MYFFRQWQGGVDFKPVGNTITYRRWKVITAAIVTFGHLFLIFSPEVTPQRALKLSSWISINYRHEWSYEVNVHEAFLKRENVYFFGRGGLLVIVCGNIWSKSTFDLIRSPNIVNHLCICGFALCRRFIDCTLRTSVLINLWKLHKTRHRFSHDVSLSSMVCFISCNMLYCF